MSKEDLVEKLSEVGINGEWIDEDEYGFSRLFQFELNGQTIQIEWYCNYSTIMIGNANFWFDRISTYSGYPRQGKWIEFSFRNEHPLHLKIGERGVSMTESEAKGFIQGKLDCMEKCDVFNKEDKHRNNECELCDYCYSQGNFGNQKEAFSVAINTLEKQEKIKDLLDSCTAYPDDMCDCLVEIEKILRSDEE